MIRAGTADQREEAGQTVFFFLLASAVMLFATFTAAVLIRRTAPDWRPFELPGLLWASTGAIALSSLALELARRDAARVRPWIAATVLLGLLFAGLQVAAWRKLADAGLFLDSNPRASFLYVLTAVHGVHLLAGVICLLAGAAGRMKLPTAAAWWHFVGGLWAYLFVLLNVF